MARRYRSRPLRVPEDAAAVATYDADGNLQDLDGNTIEFTPAVADLAEGDILYHDGTDLVRLPIGTEGQVLTVVSGVPAWAGP